MDIVQVSNNEIGIHAFFVRYIFCVYLRGLNANVPILDIF